jgi:RNA polymerase sigma-70 factor (ECF subfamily)
VFTHGQCMFTRKAERSALDATELASFLPSNETSPEAKLIVQERTEQVRVALDTLSVNQRRIFLLRFFAGLNIEEISESIGMPVNTVKTHLHRAITAIRGQLGVKK